MSITEAIDAVLADLTALLDGMDVLVTEDPTSAGRAIAAGQAVVVVFPPNVEYPTHFQEDFSWQVMVASGPANDKREALVSIDAVLDVLTANQDKFSLESAEVASFAPNSQPEFLAYVIRFTS